MQVLLLAPSPNPCCSSRLPQLSPLSRGRGMTGCYPPSLLSPAGLDRNSAHK